MGKCAAAITGVTEWKPSRVWDPPMFALEAAAQLAAEALADADLVKDPVDAVLIPGPPESPLFAPSALAEYLGLRSNFNEVVDLGGATACGMIWRAAAAIELEEGPRMTAKLVGCAPEALRVGLPVDAVFERVDDVGLVQFRPRT